MRRPCDPFGNGIEGSEIRTFLIGPSGCNQVAAHQPISEQPMSATPNFPLPRRTFLLGGLAGLLVPSAASAQSYPSNVIRVVVPASAGTPPDIISRVIADELAVKEGWRLIVENRPG